MPKQIFPLLLVALMACADSDPGAASSSGTGDGEQAAATEPATPTLSMAELLAAMPEEPMPDDPEALTRAQRDGESVAAEKVVEIPEPSPAPTAEPTPEPTPEPTVKATPESTPAPIPKTAAPKLPSGTLSVESAMVAKQVVDRQPTGAGPFPDGGTVWTWNRILNPEGQRRTVRHIYYRDGQRIVAVPLAIKNVSWRTWSRTSVQGAGSWRVDIVDENDVVLKSLPFVVE